VLDAVEAHLRAFNARDVEGVLALFADDAVFATADGLVVGLRALRALFTEAFQEPVGAALELRRAVVEADTAACELVERLALPDGGVAELPVAAFYTVVRGELARVRVYRDLPG
jgi:hypothetical protein